MKRKQNLIQYTVRGVSERTDRLLREKAAEYGTSLNETLLRALQRGLGETESPKVHDLDAYAGTWIEDPECEIALEEMRQVDEDMWK